MYDHPSAFEQIELDEANESELWEHHITATEAWQVLAGEPTWVRNKKDRAGVWKAVGTTDGGRWLTLPVEYRADSRTARPITGWDTTKGERARYG